jgi:hypothetical protein
MQVIPTYLPINIELIPSVVQQDGIQRLVVGCMKKMGCVNNEMELMVSNSLNNKKQNDL